MNAIKRGHLVHEISHISMAMSELIRINEVKTILPGVQKSSYLSCRWVFTIVIRSEGQLFLVWSLQGGGTCLGYEFRPKLGTKMYIRKINPLYCVGIRPKCNFNPYIFECLVLVLTIYKLVPYFFKLLHLRIQVN